MRIPATLAVTFFLIACTAERAHAPIPPDVSSASSASSLRDTMTFDDASFHVSFAYPAAYRAQPKEDTTIAYFDATIKASDVRIAKGEGESAFIDVLHTTDPVIVTYLEDLSSQQTERTVSGTKVREFHEDGMGDPIAYLIQKDGAYTVISFVFIASEERENILASLKIR